MGKIRRRPRPICSSVLSVSSVPLESHKRREPGPVSVTGSLISDISRILSDRSQGPAGRSFISLGFAQALRFRGVRLLPERFRITPVWQATSSLFCLAPHGVFPAIQLTLRPGGLLPRLFTLIRPSPDGIFSVTLSVNRPLRAGCPHFRRACCLSVFGLSSSPLFPQEKRSPVATRRVPQRAIGSRTQSPGLN